MAIMNAMLQRMARQQGRQLTRDEDDLMNAASQPTQTQMMIQQMMQPAPQPQPAQEPPMQMAAAPDPFGGVSAQTRNAMHKMGAADPTGEMGDMMIGRAANKPTNSAEYAAKTSVRGPSSPAQSEQLVKMLMGRGMSREEAQARVKGL